MNFVLLNFVSSGNKQYSRFFYPKHINNRE